METLFFTLMLPTFSKGLSKKPTKFQCKTTDNLINYLKPENPATETAQGHREECI
jgi:hypothetical protein